MKSPNHIDLGLAVSGLNCTFGVPKTQAELASYCTWDPTRHQWRTISRQRLDQIEKRALRKIRNYLHRNPELRDELSGLFGTRNCS